MTAGAWFLIVCCLAAAVAAGVTTVRTALLARTIKVRADELKTLPWLERFQSAAARIQRDVEGLAPLIDRSRAAIDRIDAAGSRLRLPQAALAVRLAMLAFASLRR